jgi:hypothetical protein
MGDIFDEVAEQAPDPSMWKDPSKVLVTRNRITGRLQRWKLQDGTPVLISEEGK